MPQFIGIDSQFAGFGSCRNSDRNGGSFILAVARLIPHGQPAGKVGEVESRAAGNCGTQGTGN
jgi:hypothetical protein